jgi:hypothetical protein
MADKKWIQKAIKNPGALRKQAKAAGAITSRGTISKSWLQQKAKQGGTVGRRARLAITLSKLRKKK